MHCGVARARQGAIERAKAAMREALHHAPGHAAAKAQGAALQHVAPKPEPTSRAREERREPAATRPAAGQDAVLSAWKPSSPPLSLGLAVGFLRKKPAFAKLQFGEWSQVLITQIDRGHFFFVIDQQRKIRGFLGWALTSEPLAERWVEGRAGMRNEECLAGDCVIINAWSAETPGVNRFIVETGRRNVRGQADAYFKRHYPEGRSQADAPQRQRFRRRPSRARRTPRTSRKLERPMRVLVLWPIPSRPASARVCM